MNVDRLQDLMTTLDHLKSERAYYDNNKMSPPRVGYICWLDVMGVGSAMSRSLPIAANWVMNLHACALRDIQGREQDVYLFPMVDGIYAWSDRPDAILDWIRRVFRRLALTFLFQDAPQHRFLARAALAYGRVFMGTGNHGENRDLKSSPRYCDQVLLSPALASSYEGERRAPAFGLYVDASVRTTTDFAPLRQVFWRWWEGLHGQDSAMIAEALAIALERHFDWCHQHSDEILYSRERIAVHRRLTAQYYDSY